MGNHNEVKKEKQGASVASKPPEGLISDENPDIGDTDDKHRKKKRNHVRMAPFMWDKLHKIHNFIKFQSAHGIGDRCHSFLKMPRNTLDK